MFARKIKPQPTQDPELAVRTESGEVMHRFPAEIVLSVRRMVTSLMYQSRLPRTVACLSALPGEGVTYTTLAFGTTLASDTKASVCIVELNWLHPGLQDLLAGKAALEAANKRKRKPSDPPLPTPPAVSVSPGVAGVVTGKATLEEALITTALPNLKLLPAGMLPIHERASITRSDELKELIEQLRNQFDYLLLDLPAVTATSDVLALAAFSEGICFVTLQGVTHVNLVKKSLDEIKHFPILGIVLNQSKMYTPRWILNLLPTE